MGGRLRAPPTIDGSAIKQFLPLVLLLATLAGCNYVAAVSAIHETYGVATDLRSLPTQESDT